MIYYVHAIIFLMTGKDVPAVSVQQNEISSIQECLRAAHIGKNFLEKIAKETEINAKIVDIVCIAKERAE